MLYTIWCLLEYLVNDGKKSATFLWKIHEKISIQRAAIKLNFPMGQLSNITTRWCHQTVIKEREIKVNHFYQKAVKYLSDIKRIFFFILQFYQRHWIWITKPNFGNFFVSVILSGLGCRLQTCRCREAQWFDSTSWAILIFQQKNMLIGMFIIKQDDDDDDDDNI